MLGDTVAVKVTVAPTPLGFCEELRLVVVGEVDDVTAMV